MTNSIKQQKKAQSRRSFLRALCTAGLMPATLGGLRMLVPHPALAGTLSPALSGGPRWDRYVVVIHLVGGNDGLNTLVPYREKTYYQSRPTLAIDPDQVLKISDTLGLNPSMEALMPVWQANELAFVQNVGYPHVIRSHLRSMEIWDTAADGHAPLQDGWIGQLFSHVDHSALDLDGIAIGLRNKGIMRGDDMRVFRMDGVDAVNRLDFTLNHPEENIQGSPQDSAMDYLLDAYAATANAKGLFDGIDDVDIPNKADFPQFAVGSGLLQAAQIIKKGLQVPAIVTSQNGFDNHSNQREFHTQELGHLSAALSAFRRALIDMGMWDKVLVITNSEFGRRVEENGNLGTDHGSAAPHLLMGGRVRGGLYGPDPDLEYLDERGDIQFTTHFRELFATTAAWWNLPDSARAAVFGKHKPLRCLRL